MTVFAVMDEWLACTGSTDDDWLNLGLDVVQGWQASTRSDVATGQDHLASTLAALHAHRSVEAVRDPVRLAVWFHHCAALHPSLLDRLASLGGPELGARVGWLVRGLAAGTGRAEDPAAALLHAVHRTALTSPHLSPVRAEPPAQ